MTFRQLRFLKCDGCEVELLIEEAQSWYSVSGIITSPEQYEALARRAEDTGSSGIISGDFCSLSCLSRWAANADTLRGMEDGAQD